MKKVISLVILTALLVVLVAPAVVSAQEKLKECCTLSQEIDLGEGASCDKGNIVAPNTAAARGCGVAGNDCSAVADGMSDWGMFCLVNTIYNVTNWIFYLLMVIVVVLIVIGGATYMLAAGDPEKAGRGKSIIIYGIIGLAIALLARLIPSVVKLIVGMG